MLNVKLKDKRQGEYLSAMSWFFFVD
jgi:hypothetical protein